MLTHPRVTYTIPSAERGAAIYGRGMGRPRAANDPSVRVSLTPRHEEVLELIARGKTNGEIARELGISLDGVKFHVREILSRMGVDSREEAAEAWRRRKRGPQWRMPGWFSWPVAVGFGGLAGATGVFAVALFAWGLPALSGDDGPRSQPELTAAYMGDGWQMKIDDDGGLPHARDSVLAVEWDTESPEVMLIEASTGRIAARWNVGHYPMAVLRPEANQLLISDKVYPYDEARAGHRLLIFDLGEEPGHVATVPMESRLNYIIFGMGMALTLDERHLYYAAQPGSGVRVELRAINVEQLSDSPLSDAIGAGCGWPQLSAFEADGVVARCLGSGAILVLDSRHGDRTVPPPALVQREWWRHWAMQSLNDRVQFGVDRHPVECCFVRTVGTFETETGEEIARHSFDAGEVRGIAAVDTRWALLLAGDGTFHRFDLESGDRELLPYRLPLDVEISGVELVR